ncbi:hypothetical protein FisN_14Lh305 [Fistulifera solaris]|uniref:Uncharacterized protein n=1 Tax=Fistulifera solaris TaxID=1519565 RepID=A0A1Z5JIS5_FISSO|nr:hypothetical protein FisN_14Lh305 [Fistulifera solaris]|eukprot:GAX13678.1 hypothetical protein FisN_14Lh305 [Fistulifera solaris]
MVDASSMTMLHAADATLTAANENVDKLEPTNNPSFPQTPETKSIATAKSENTAKTAYTTDTDSSARQNKSDNKSFDEDDEEEEEKSTEVDAHFYPHYEIVSRWSDLTQKRLDLCRQRVDLEQRLFEFAELRQHRDRSEKTWHSFRDPREEEKHDPSAFFNGSLRQPEPTSPTTEKPSAYPTLCSVRWETVHFPDGQIYEGQVLVLLKRSQAEPDVEEKKSRRGLFGGGAKDKKSKQNAKIVTTTEWIRHGHGYNRWPDGQVYRGAWHWNSRHGRGTHAWPDGRTVTGSWQSGHLHGRIFFSWPDDSTFDGNSVLGKKHGRGVHTWNGGKRVYSGEYESGYEQGFGCLVEQEGGVDDESGSQIRYRGNFKAGRRHGYGVQVWSDKTYDGDWEANVVHGRGKLTWHSTGASYTGDFRAGRYHGMGSYQHPTGRKYVGQWYKGRKNGTGVQCWPNGAMYSGLYWRGKRHGYGGMVYADGSLYKGGWKKGRRSGFGINISSNGRVIHCGLWSNNQPVPLPEFPLKRPLFCKGSSADDQFLLFKTPSHAVSSWNEAEHALNRKFFPIDENTPVSRQLFAVL